MTKPSGVSVINVATERYNEMDSSARTLAQLDIAIKARNNARIETAPCDG